jgi:hypothetical protein
MHYNSFVSQCDAKPLFHDELAPLQTKFQTVSKNSTAQNWQKAALPIILDRARIIDRSWIVPYERALRM